MILLTGFGPFRDVTENPSSVLAGSLDGARVGGVTVVGHVLDVSYERAPARVLELCTLFSPMLVIGTGVAVRREEVEVEAFGRGGVPEGDDNDGRCPPNLGPGRYASPVAQGLADALGVARSEDAGRYVCNAWLYRVGRGADCPVGFVHLPPSGVDPQRFLKALGRVASSLQA